jgi:sulfite exporter TauE/SafE
LIGLFLGVVVFKLESLESIRGDLAGWFLIAFGLVYFLWGVRRAIRGRSHTHRHVHADGESHSHSHSHVDSHSHVHAGERSGNITPWVLFTIFVLGPCEPLIPLIMYPAAKSSIAAAGLVALIFGVTTVATMLVAVMVCYYGLSRFKFPQAERYSHALAGLTILLCGGAIKFLGL